MCVRGGPCSRVFNLMCVPAAVALAQPSPNLGADHWPVAAVVVPSDRHRLIAAEDPSSSSPSRSSQRDRREACAAAAAATSAAAASAALAAAGRAGCRTSCVLPRWYACRRTFVFFVCSLALLLWRGAWARVSRVGHPS